MPENTLEDVLRKGWNWGEVPEQLLYSILVKWRKLSCVVERFVLLGSAKEPQDPLGAANIDGVVSPGTCMPYPMAWDHHRIQT